MALFPPVPSLHEASVFASLTEKVFSQLSVATFRWPLQDAELLLLPAVAFPSIPGPPLPLPLHRLFRPCHEPLRVHEGGGSRGLRAGTLGRPWPRCGRSGRRRPRGPRAPGGRLWERGGTESPKWKGGAIGDSKSRLVGHVQGEKKHVPGERNMTERPRKPQKLSKKIDHRDYPKK